MSPVRERVVMEGIYNEEMQNCQGLRGLGLGHLVYATLRE